jgi:hypothetical protein
MHFMNTKGFWNMANTVFIVLIVLTRFIVIIYIFIQKRSDRLDTDTQAKCKLAIARSITTIFELFSTIFFWYIFAMTGWWFIFFKL